MLQDRWGNASWRKIYFRTYKRFRAGKLGKEVDLVKLVDRLYNEEHPTQPKPLHPDLQPTKTDETGRIYHNPDYDVFKYLKSLARDDDKPSDYYEYIQDVPKGEESDRAYRHPRVRLVRRKTQKRDSLPSATDW